MIFALNDETLSTHLERLKEGGLSFCDASIKGFEETKKVDLITKAVDLGNPKMISTIGLGILMGKFVLGSRLCSKSFLWRPRTIDKNHQRSD